MVGTVSVTPVHSTPLCYGRILNKNVQSDVTLNIGILRVLYLLLFLFTRAPAKIINNKTQIIIFYSANFFHRNFISGK